jgi:hypothetical protein
VAARDPWAGRATAAIAAGALLLASTPALAVPPPAIGAPAAPPSAAEVPAAEQPPAAPAPPAVTAFPTVTATVRVLELTARAEPRRDAPVLHTFGEGEALCVSRDEAEGFRRVVLVDGRVAFVASAGLALGADAGVAAQPAARPLANLQEPAATKVVTEVTRISDLPQLSMFVRSDAEVSALARRLERKDLIANVVIGAGVGAGAVLMLWGVSSDSPDQRRALVITGAVVGLASPVIGWGMSPGKGDLQLVIRAWNDRHPEERLALK